MAKYKAVRKKVDTPPQIRPGLPCLVIIIGGIILVGLTMFWALRNG